MVEKKGTSAMASLMEDREGREEAKE